MRNDSLNQQTLEKIIHRAIVKCWDDDKKPLANAYAASVVAANDTMQIVSQYVIERNQYLNYSNKTLKSSNQNKENENTSEISVSMDDVGFKKAWESWLYCTDVVKFDRDIALRTAIEAYLGANKPVSSQDIAYKARNWFISYGKGKVIAEDVVKAIFDTIGMKYVD